MPRQNAMKRNEFDECYELVLFNFEEFRHMVHNRTHNVRTYGEIAAATKNYDYLFIQTNEDINSLDTYSKTIMLKVSVVKDDASVAAAQPPAEAKMTIWDDVTMTSATVNIKEFLLDYFHHFANVDKIHEKILKNEGIEFKELYRNKKTTFLAFVPTEDVVYSDEFCEYMEKNHDSFA